MPGRSTDRTGARGAGSEVHPGISFRASGLGRASVPCSAGHPDCVVSGHPSPLRPGIRALWCPQPGIRVLPGIRAVVFTAGHPSHTRPGIWVSLPSYRGIQPWSAGHPGCRVLATGHPGRLWPGIRLVLAGISSPSDSHADQHVRSSLTGLPQPCFSPRFCSRGQHRDQQPDHLTHDRL